MFPTLVFGVFFVFVLATSWGLERENNRRKLLLLAASYLFYGWWDWRFCALLAGSSILNWMIGNAIGSSTKPGTRKMLVVLGVALNLAVLVLFKYYGFFIENLSFILELAGIERDLIFLQVILPVGISFYTFQGISYVVDVKRGDVEPCPRLTDVMLYISFFPQLVAGPIVRAKDFLPQLEATPRLSRDAVTLGLLLIVWGLFKKTVIAAELSSGLVDPVFFDPTYYGTIDLVFATYGYAVQIYCDFSAYSDIAIGCAALLGYRFQRNFDQPYRARSLQDFWRRWHISLSTWLRDYLFIPMGGSRGSEFSTKRNIFITMLLGGIWHGAAWTFVLWGSLHGVALAVERQLGLARKGRGILSLIVTFHIVCFGWILFRSSSFDLALDFFVGLTQWRTPVEVLTPFLAGLTVLGLAMHALPSRGIETWARVLGQFRSPVVGLSLAGLFLIVEALRSPGVAPFIYFQF